MHHSNLGSSSQLNSLNFKSKKAMKREKRKAKRTVDKINAINGNLKDYVVSSSIVKRESKYTVALDFSFIPLMTVEETNICVKFLKHVYDHNKLSRYPLTIHFTSVTEGNNIHKYLKNFNEHSFYRAIITPNPFTDMFQRNKIVYLTSKSENTIEDLEEDKIYIIAGYHNKKHTTDVDKLGAAFKAGVQHAKLPLDRYRSRKKKTRNVLNIEHGKILIKLLIEIQNMKF